MSSKNATNLCFNFHNEATQWRERNATPNKKRSKTTDTTPRPEKTTHPPASPHKAKSTKHRNRNTHKIHTYHPTSNPIQTEMQTNSPNSYKSHSNEHSPPKKQKPSPMHYDTTTAHGWNGQANRKPNPSPSIR